MSSAAPPAKRNMLEGLLRSRTMRVSLAGTLIVIGIWSLSPYAFYNVAPSAFVNAELVRIAAPISGIVTEDLPRKGDMIDSTSAAKLIRSISNDRSSLKEAEEQYENAKAREQLSTLQIAELKAADEALAKRTAEYRAAIRNRFERTIGELALEIAACKRELEVRRLATTQAETMADKQLLAAVRLNTIKGEFYRAEQACHALSAREQQLKSERDASLSGTFIQDGVGAPFSEQERSRLLLSRQELERNLFEVRSQLSQLNAKTPALRSFVESLDNYGFKLPEGHIVWSVLASPGTAVVEGQTILELADCQRPFIMAEFPERSLAAIKPGNSAYYRLIGDNAWQKGTVRRIRGSAARKDNTFFAAAIPNPKENYISVEISMAGTAGPSDSDRACDIGRLAEVRLQSSSLDVLSWFVRSPTAPEPVAKQL